MATGVYEVEIKSLLGNAEAAAALKERMTALDPSCVLRVSSTQLNHYFEGGDPKELSKRIAAHLSKEGAEKLKNFAKRGTKISVRTRGEDGKAYFVMKASIGSDTSDNGVARAELQEVAGGLSLDALDAEVLAAGYRYQAKWSRAREEFLLGDVAVCVDHGPGYGYVAEFEKVVDEAARAEAARAELLLLMEQLGVSELPQARLERMFAFYNAHWPEYYGTDKIFVID